MKRLINIVFLLIIFSCTSIKINQQEKINDKGIELYYNSVNSQNSDSLDVLLIIRANQSSFIFNKQRKQFFSNLTYTINISNQDDTKIYRKSWDQLITESFYEDTRDQKRTFDFIKNIRLLPGDYNVYINIQDLQHQKYWDLKEKINIKKNFGISEFLSFKKLNRKIEYFPNYITNKDDFIYFTCQILNGNNKNIEQGQKRTNLDSISYFIMKDDFQIDSGLVSIFNKKVNDIYDIQIPIKKEYYGRVEIGLRSNGFDQRLKININDEFRIFWTNDKVEICDVHEFYILGNEERREFKKLDIENKIKYLEDFWLANDPTIESKANELLVQLNKRVSFVNKDFSGLKPGWRTDRGRIYIIYGPPDSINNSYDNQKERTYEIWKYTNGKEFIFAVNEMLDNYELIQEIN